MWLFTFSCDYNSAVNNSLCENLTQFPGRFTQLLQGRSRQYLFLSPTSWQRRFVRRPVLDHWFNISTFTGVLLPLVCWGATFLPDVHEHCDVSGFYQYFSVKIISTFCGRAQRKRRSAVFRRVVSFGDPSSRSQYIVKNMAWLNHVIMLNSSQHAPQNTYHYNAILFVCSVHILCTHA